MSKMLDIIKPDFTFFDERGSFYQLCHKNWEQVNFSKTKKGAKRGEHYHKESKEAFFIIDGEIELILEKENQIENYSFKTGDFFVILPYALHSFNFKTDTLMIALYDKSVTKDDGSKDIYNRGE